MRVCLKLFLALFFCAAILRADDAATSDFDADAAREAIEKLPEETQVFLKGLDFYSRGDYAAARALFEAVPADGSQRASLAAYYLANISAFEGEEGARALFERAIENPPPKMRAEILRRFAQYEYANKDYAHAVGLLEPIAAETDDTLAKWVYANSLWHAGEKEKAEAFLSAFVKEYFGDVSAAGVDAFVEAYLKGDKAANGFDISALKADNSVSTARLEMLKGEKITPPQNEISLLAQIMRYEAGQKTDAALLEESAQKYASAPFAWRAYLALGEIEFKKGEYEKAGELAIRSEQSAPQRLLYQAKPLMLLGDSYRMRKMYDDARAAYLEIAMNRDSRGEPHAEALYKTGICWFEQRDWAKAYAYFERVFVGYFQFEYWGSRAYFYGAQSVYALGDKRGGNSVLSEYFRRAKDKDSAIYRQAREYFDDVTRR